MTGTGTTHHLDSRALWQFAPIHTDARTLTNGGRLAGHQLIHLNRAARLMAGGPPTSADENINTVTLAFCTDGFQKHTKLIGGNDIISSW